MDVIFVGFNVGVKGYKHWDPSLNKMIISHDVRFDKAIFVRPKEPSREVLYPLENTSIIISKIFVMSVQVEIYVGYEAPSDTEVMFDE